MADRAPISSTLNWCYGVVIADGRLIVAETGNRRVLVWNEILQWNGAPADLVLGQRDMSTRDENAGEGLARAACAGRTRPRSPQA